MSACKNINSLGINSPSKWEEVPSNGGSNTTEWILNVLEPAMTACTNINSLGINSPSKWEEVPSNEVREVT